VVLGPSLMMLVCTGPRRSPGSPARHARHGAGRGGRVVIHPQRSCRLGPAPSRGGGFTRLLSRSERAHADPARFGLRDDRRRPVSGWPYGHPGRASNQMMGSGSACCLGNARRHGRGSVLWLRTRRPPPRPPSDAEQARVTAPFAWRAPPGVCGGSARKACRSAARIFRHVCSGGGLVPYWRQHRALTKRCCRWKTPATRRLAAARSAARCANHLGSVQSTVRCSDIHQPGRAHETASP
jgi:hypothetical protein